MGQRRTVMAAIVSAASAFRHAPLRADWGRMLDGMVVFREERPATPLAG